MAASDNLEADLETKHRSEQSDVVQELSMEDVDAEKRYSSPWSAVVVVDSLADRAPIQARPSHRPAHASAHGHHLSSVLSR